MEVDLRFLASVFGTVFVAELADKTQVATVLFASKPGASLVGVFLAASAALVLSTFFAVAAGGILAQYVDGQWLTRIAGAGFIAIGAWTLWTA